MKVVIAGGTGQIGKMLIREYEQRGYEITVLTRSANSPGELQWDGRSLGDWARALEGADLVINLAGRTVNCRYTKENLQQMYDSRMDSTRVLGEAISSCINPPKVWMQMSTATIYAHSFDQPNDEFTGVIGGAEPGAPEYWDFSIKIAKDWEKVLQQAQTPKTKKVALRSAMVMSPDQGGVFSELTRLTKLGLGGTIAGGQQMVSWIHEKDFIEALDFIYQSGEEGVFNLASPNPLPQKEFMKRIRNVYGVWIGLPATKTMAKVGAVVMKTDAELILKSRYVVPARLEKMGYQFHFPNWSEAVRNLAFRSRNLLSFHFLKFAFTAYIFTCVLLGFLFKNFDGFKFAVGIAWMMLFPFLAATWISNKIFRKSIYRRQHMASAIGLSILSACVVAWFSFSLLGTTDIFRSLFLGYHKSVGSILFSSLSMGLVAVAYGGPGILIFGTWMAIDSQKKIRLIEIKNN